MFKFRHSFGDELDKKNIVSCDRQDFNDNVLLFMAQKTVIVISRSGRYLLYC